jgi:hypothetical protein
MRKYSLALFALFALSLVAPTLLPAQGSAGNVTVFGRVQDAASKAPVPFLTIQLRREKDSTFVAGRLTDQSGAFTFAGLQQGAYVLSARIIGYEPIRQRVLVGELSAFLDLGVMTMTAVTRTLSEVTITS